MAQKTYLDGLGLIIAKLCKYITKYGGTFIPLLTPAQVSALNAVNAACTSFLALIRRDVE